MEDRAAVALLVWTSQEELTRASSGSLWPQLGDKAQRQRVLWRCLLELRREEEARPAGS